MDIYNIIKYPLSSEKSIRLMESENKLIFVVRKKASKKEIKKGHTISCQKCKYTTTLKTLEEVEPINKSL